MRSTEVQPLRAERLQLFSVFAVAALALLLAFLLEAHRGFNLWDEGYLWYGVQRVLHGEVPLRDFMSYDPARYYWSAGLLWLAGSQGIVAVRAAATLFFGVGLLSAVWLVWRGTTANIVQRGSLCLLTVALCLLWMEPWWKNYDEAISIVLTASLAWTLANPIARRFFLHGVVVGVAALFGRNHGVYGVIACFFATPMLALAKPQPRWRLCIPACTGGVLLGFCPILIGLLLDRPFANMFWDSIRFMLFESKSTNLPLPVPWPWTIASNGRPMFDVVHDFLVGCCFLALPVFCIVGMLHVLRSLWRERRLVHPAFAASIVTAIAYLNVAFSRADLNHLAQAIFPCLLGVMLWPSFDARKIGWRWAGVCLLVLVSLCVALPMHPVFAMHRQGNWQSVQIGDDTLWIDPGTATSVNDVRTLAKRYVPTGDTLLAVPVWPGAYALLAMKAPLYEIYPLFPRSEAFQQQEIARLQRASPSLVLLNDISVDGRSDLRYAQTHPHILQYIITHYRPRPSPTGEPQLKVYVADAAAAPIQAR